MKNLLFTDHKVTNRSFRALCSEIIEFHDVLIVLNLQDLLITIKSLFLNNNNRSNNNNNHHHNNHNNNNNNNNNNFKHTIFYNKIKFLTKLN